MQNDIELAVTGMNKEQREGLFKKVPRAYTVEDRTGTGYGLVVRSDASEGSGEINSRIENFLKPLAPLAETVRPHGCILRVVIFTSFLTTTLTLETASLEILQSFNAKLEISVYPTDEESRQQLSE